MNLTENDATTEESVLLTDQEKETLLFHWKYGSAKTMRAILIIGALFLLIDMLALYRAGLLSNGNIIYSFIVPLIYFGLGYMSRVKPMLAMILATVLFIGVNAMTVSVYGWIGIFYGGFIKLVMIYFILNGFINARDADLARKRLAVFS